MGLPEKASATIRYNESYLEDFQPLVPVGSRYCTQAGLNYETRESRNGRKTVLNVPESRKREDNKV